MLGDARVYLMAFLVASATGLAWGRTWTSESGGSRVDADLIEYANGRVVLRKATGTKVTVEIHKLCEADRQYAESWLRKQASQMTGRLAWEVDLQGVADSSPIISRGICVAAVSVGQVQGPPQDFRVVAVAADSGKFLWQYKLTNARPGPLHVAGDLVVFGASLVDEFATPPPEPPTLVALKLADGTLSWKKQFPAQRDANSGRDLTDVTHIAIGAGRLATLADGLVVFDFAGNELWRNDQRHYNRIGGDADWLIVAKGDAVSDTDKAEIAAFRWEGREAIWRKELGTRLISMSRPVIAEDQVLMGTTSAANTLLARLVGGMPYLYCLTKTTGDERWKTALRWNEYGGGLIGEPTAVGERVFLADVVGSLVLDGATGKSLEGSWSAQGLVGVIFEPLDANTVFDGERARDALNGQIRWELPAAEGRKPFEWVGVRTQCCWLTGKLYIVDRNGWLRCIE